MSNESERYSMTISMQILEHLGLNLYSNTSAVVSEAVANSWDADATQVNIDIDTNSKTVTISDNGNGMSLDDINNRYLLVGYKKREEVPLTPKYKRKVMGRKGIGKLSLFSIADTISLYTRKNGEQNALELSAAELKREIDKKGVYHPQPLDWGKIGFDGDGTKIVLSNLKKNINATLASALKKRLARRFSIIGDNFNVYVDGSLITPIDRGYLPKAQFLWRFVPSSVTNSDERKNLYLDQCGKNLAGSYILPNIVTISQQDVEASESFEVSGWIATSKEPGDLKDDEQLNRIVIMVRGKMAKENILDDVPLSALYSKYIFGEIHADFLDMDDKEDVATSNRQDFFNEDERFVALKQFVVDSLKEIRKTWEEQRTIEGEKTAVQFRVVKKWYEGRTGEEQRTAKALFGKINRLTVTPEEKQELLKHGILAFESLRLRKELDRLNSLDESDLQTFLKLAGSIDSIAATHYYQVVMSRLEVIEKMEQIVDEGALEKVVQRYLAEHLWILDPAWNKDTMLPRVEQAIRTEFESIRLSDEEKNSRLDIRYVKPSNKNVVIELKRSSRKMDFNEIILQVNKYHKALKKVLPALGEGIDFEIIVLIGRRSNEDICSDADDMKQLAAKNARIMYYDELIKNAQALYRDFLERNKEMAVFTDIIKEL